MLPGTYNYSFKSHLPIGLPSSFESKYGHIRYFICVIIHRRNTWLNEQFEVPFTVIKQIDLRNDPSHSVISSIFLCFLCN